jgi:hypothetical protein
MNNAIAALRAEGAFVDDGHEIPNQADISAPAARSASRP